MSTGDFVRLKSGSPTMMVTYIDSSGKIHVLWYDNGIKDAAVFPQYLEPVPEPTKESKSRFEREWPL